MSDHERDPHAEHGGMNTPTGDSRTAGGSDGGHGAHGDMARGGMVSSVTRPQLFAVSFATVLALAAAVIYCAFHANLSLSARDVGEAVMPPGMIAAYDTPASAMREMAAVDPRFVGYTAPPDARGDQPLEPRVENGVKVFDLDASIIKWNILPDVQVMAYAFNRQVPGPRIRITEGDRVRINVTNHLPEATSVHWHGLIVPNAMDGAAEITQRPIQPGETYVYEFTVRQHGTFFYHSHREPDRQQALGLYGALIIDPKDLSARPAYDREYTVQLQEWLYRQGYTFPAMMMEGALPNYFTINGKAYPSTDTLDMKVGQKLLLRFIGSHNNFIHPMHIHGGPFTVVATDGNLVPQAARIEKDTINVAPGERYDAIWTAREPGRWLIHCHMPHHMTNNNVEVKRRRRSDNAHRCDSVESVPPATTALARWRLTERAPRRPSPGTCPDRLGPFSRSPCSRRRWSARGPSPGSACRVPRVPRPLPGKSVDRHKALALGLSGRAGER